MRPTEKDTPAPRPGEPSPRKAWIVSALVHAAVVAVISGYGLLQPRVPATATLELVSGEASQTLRPPAPKPPAPPAETPPAPAPEPEPDDVALVAKPKEPKTPPKPEPKKPVSARDTVAKATKPAAPAPAPAPSTGAAAGGTEGGVSVSNAQGNPALSRWAARVRAIIHPQWKPPMGVDVEVPAITVVRFNVGVEDGRIYEVEVAKSSGNRLLDEEALRAVRRRDRVPAPRDVVPGNFSEDFLQVSYEFIYRGLEP